MNALQSPLHGLLDPRDNARIKHALSCSASSRDILSLLVAAGMQAGIAGSVTNLSMSAHAQTSRRGGRIRVLRKLQPIPRYRLDSSLITLKNEETKI